MNPLIQLEKATLPFLVVPVLVCLALSHTALAVSPPPDGGYPGGNTAEGQNALLSRTTGGYNAAIGWLSLRGLTSGSFNTGVGAGTLALNNADQNTAIGAGALLSNTTGVDNTATGARALLSNSGGIQNTANGVSALLFNSTGGSNTAVGHGALLSNMTGSGNTATGFSALYHNVNGIGNVAGGINALYVNSSGNFNTANGVNALYNNDTGHDNTATGYAALGANIDGSNNTAIGDSALLNMAHGSFNVAMGQDAGFNLAAGNGNVYIGLGMNGTAAEANHTYIANIKDTNVSGLNTDSVTVNLNTGLLGHATSSRRYKKDIKPMENASEAMYRLNPVTYRYKKEIDSTESPAFGLIAEEVAEVNPALVGRNSKGQPENVHYEMVNAMLLNEFLKEHRKNEEQQATIARQQKQIEVLAVGLQKVNAQLEVIRPAPQIALNNP